jgi:cytochrome c553
VSRFCKSLLFFGSVFFFNDLTSAAAREQSVEQLAKGLCLACHGPGGVSQNDLWPSLAGQKRGYLLKQLQDFRAGRRYDPLMSPVSKTLNETDLEALASYYSELK